MKIYFTGSLHNEGIDKELYRTIVDFLEKMGHVVKADHILRVDKSALETQTVSQRSEFYKKLQRWISSSDIVVAEISYPSTLNIGHEISMAIDKGVPVVGLYRNGRPPGLLLGISSEKLLLVEYTIDSLFDILKDAVEEVASKMDTRFNFFISPQIGAYLDWIAKNKRIPRAVYLRRLIENDMQQNKEYNSD